MSLRDRGTQASIEVNHRRGGKRVERCAQVRHRCSENRGDENARNPMRHVRNNEGRKDAVRLPWRKSCRRRNQLIKDEERNSHQQKQRKLNQNEDAAREQRQLRLFF